jgi:hypothetical protein
MGLVEVKEFILKQVKKIDCEYTSEWIDNIKKAQSIQEVLGG